MNYVVLDVSTVRHTHPFVDGIVTLLGQDVCKEIESIQEALSAQVIFVGVRTIKGKLDQATLKLLSYFKNKHVFLFGMTPKAIDCSNQETLRSMVNGHVIGTFLYEDSMDQQEAIKDLQMSICDSLQKYHLL